MKIDLIVFPIIIILSFLLGQNNTSGNRKTFIVLVSLVLLLKASLRGMSVGSDTHVYYQDFISIISTPWEQVIAEFLERYSSLSGDYDVGYDLLQKTISVFTKDFHVFTFIAQLLFYVPFGILLYRFCSDFHQLTFAYVLYVALFMGLPMANARQFYSIGLSITALLYLYEKKYVKCVICVVLGYFIHQTALLFVVPFMLSFLPPKIVKHLVLIAFVLFPFALIYSNQIIFFMGNFVENERYAAYGTQKVQGGATTYITMSLMMNLFCYFAIKNHHLFSDYRLKSLYVMLPLSIVLCPLIYSNGSMIRIVMYYQIFFVILFPYALDIVFAKNRKEIYFSVILLLIVMSLLASGNNYVFFWQE